MSENQELPAVKAFFAERDGYAKHSDMELLSVTTGGAVARMTVRDIHLNGVGTTHGGAIFTLADFAFSAACNSRGQISVLVNAAISFLKGTGVGDVLTATVREVSPGPKLAQYVIEVVDQDGDVIASLQGMAYRKRDYHDFSDWEK